jgi:hypothetical protein
MQDRIRLEKKVQVPVSETNFAGFRDTYISVAESLISNGDFSAGCASWLLCAGWTIANSQATCDGTQTGNTSLAQSVVLVPGKKYDVGFFVLSISAGSVRALVGDTLGTARTTAGYWQEQIVAGAGGTLGIQGDASFAGVVTLVMAAEVVEVWAEVKQYLFGEWVGGKQIRETETMRATFRYRKDFESDHFIYHVGQDKRYKLTQFRHVEYEYIEAAIEEIEDAA